MCIYVLYVHCESSVTDDRSIRSRCSHICIHMYTYIDKHSNTYVHNFKYIYIYIYVFIFIHCESSVTEDRSIRSRYSLLLSYMYTHVCIHMYMYIDKHRDTHFQIYIHIYIYIVSHQWRTIIASAQDIPSHYPQ
jgi:hypothetical protein